MKNFLSVITAIGFVIFILGIGAGDSENFLIPLGMIAVGGGLMLGSGYFLRSYYPQSHE